MYTRNGVNWYKLFDDYVDSINVVPEALSNVLSVMQLDEQNPASSDLIKTPTLPQGVLSFPAKGLLVYSDPAAMSHVQTV